MGFVIMIDSTISDTQWHHLRMRNSGRNYVCKNTDIELETGEYYVVQLERGEDYAKFIGDKNPSKDEIEATIVKKIKRKLNDFDLRRIEENKVKEERAFIKCQRRIAEHNLEMKLINVEFSLDSSRIVFYFTADGRVDFRELVKSLASDFRSRIELRQIGVRDETKIVGNKIGCIGSCGRTLCCASHLHEFKPVTIRMAKDQRLPLNPTKISGVCGRLKCCLRYEFQTYREEARTMPEEGSSVETSAGVGTIIDMNILKKTVLVIFENNNIIEFSVNEIKKAAHKKQCGVGCGRKKGVINELDVDENELKGLED